MKHGFLRSIAILIVAVAWPPSVGAAASLDSVLARYPADSLVLPLRRFENEASLPREGAEAALMLGHLHYARAEYRPAADAFARAGARLDPARKPEARYWAGLCWLALGDDRRSRAALEEVAQSQSSLRIDARLALAIAWEEARRPDRAIELLEPLVREGRGEAMPAILEHAHGLATRLHRVDLANRARTRLLAEYPRSMEAARLGHVPPTASGVVVELGPFPSEPRAHAVADRARALGFTGARAETRGSGRDRAYVVRLGAFDSDPEARHAADQARRELDVPARVIAR
jgi:hypothetical protein